MKYLIVLLLVLAAASSQAQITLEHNYQNNPNEFGLVQVDSGIFKYILFNSRDSIYIFNLDHSIDRVIPLHLDSAIRPQIEYISKRLFDTDDAYEFLIFDNYIDKIIIFKENGTILFTCMNCALYAAQNDIQDPTTYPASIISTPNGVKMLTVTYANPSFVSVYSLPGKLPGGTAKSGVNSPSIISGNSFPTSAYPNPSNGQMRISYKLPLGVASGELVILSTDGVEVKRYRVGYGFNDILVEKSDLPSGSYFYKLVTDKGESETQKLIILK